jgi:hypothetical protein
MSARGFAPVFWAGTVAAAALGFYLVSLRVASERAALEDVETEIAMAQRDIRLLQTEIGTRGRLAQLERWNVRFIRLSAPTADQFVEGGFQLATLIKPEAKPAIAAPVILASAPVEQEAPKLTGDAPTSAATSRPVNEMVHVASYSVPDKTPAVKQRIVTKPAAPVANWTTGPSKPVKAPAATKPVKTATADPLAPLQTVKPKAKGSPPKAASGAGSSKAKPKDSVTD